MLSASDVPTASEPTATVAAFEPTATIAAFEPTVATSEPTVATAIDDHVVVYAATTTKEAATEESAAVEAREEARLIDWRNRLLLDNDRLLLNSRLLNIDDLSLIHI